VEDSCLIVSSTSLSTLEQECNIELKKLQKRLCNANTLEINLKKSASLLILSKLNAPKGNLDIIYNDCSVANSENSRYIYRCNIQSCTIFQSLGLEGLKSRLDTLKSRKMGMSRPYFFISPMKLFQHPNMPKAILFQGYLILYKVIL